MGVDAQTSRASEAVGGGGEGGAEDTVDDDDDLGGDGHRVDAGLYHCRRASSTSHADHRPDRPL